MSRDAKSMAAMLVHKQIEFGRQRHCARSSAFASTIFDRFFIDNSLGHKDRLIEATKRRQARARKKALVHEQELTRLQQEHERRRKLRELRGMRETSRMTRKLQHVAAAYIQHVFRCFRQRQRQRNYASRTIATCMFKWWVNRCKVKNCASLHIQRWWRRCIAVSRVLVLRTVVASLVEERRRHRHHCIQCIQRCFLCWRHRRRRWGAATIQRTWRRHWLRMRLLQRAEEFRLQQMRLHQDAAARVLQQTLGQAVVRRRLLRSSALARFSELREWRSRWRANRLESQQVNESLRRALSDASAGGRRLHVQESQLRSAMQDLAIVIRQSYAKAGEERERLRRFHAWAELRRTKEDGLLREQLGEWEARKRFEIRLELEHELELERRASLKARRSSPSPAIDGRVEVD